MSTETLPQEAQIKSPAQVATAIAAVIVSFAGGSFLKFSLGALDNSTLALLYCYGVIALVFFCLPSLSEAWVHSSDQHLLFLHHFLGWIRLILGVVIVGVPAAIAVHAYSSQVTPDNTFAVISSKSEKPIKDFVFYVVLSHDTDPEANADDLEMIETDGIISFKASANKYQVYTDTSGKIVVEIVDELIKPFKVFAWIVFAISCVLVVVVAIAERLAALLTEIRQPASAGT